MRNDLKLNMDDKIKMRMIDLAVSRLGAAEIVGLLKLAEEAIRLCGKYPKDGKLLEQLKNGKFSTAFSTLAVEINRAWRMASQLAGTLGRNAHLKELVYIRERLAAASLVHAAEYAAGAAAPTPPQATATVERGISKVYELALRRSPVQAEVEEWKRNLAGGLSFHEFLLLIADSTESKLSELSDGAFIQSVYEIVLGRGCKAWELAKWTANLAANRITRADALAAIFNEAVKLEESGATRAVHDGLSCQIMGTTHFVTASDWKGKSLELAQQKPAPIIDERYAKRFYIQSQPRVLVSAVTSLYRGGEFIDQFMENITSQSCFNDYCELIIVDADSPENEHETIRRYLARHKNINYIRINYRIGIYDAWNVGVKASSGDYLTNANLDDLRRADSFEQQAAVLDNLPFVDVTYQDFYYTFDPRLSYEEVLHFGCVSNLPIITPYNMMEFNSPHNAPMWRKALHEELGYFDTNYKSAGDYEFWMRCLAAGKCFYKLNDPHVIYYQNPKGLSTRPDSRGVVEANAVLKTYGRKLVSENIVMPFEQFCRERLPGVPVALAGADKNRYNQVQRALRNTARQLKYPAAGGSRP